MFRSITVKLISATGAAALMAGLVISLTSTAPDAKAAPAVAGALHQAHPKGDRLSVLVRGAPCSLRSWPYYDQNCRFDLRRPANEAPTVRVLAFR
jgi:hypothetical protein